MSQAAAAKLQGVEAARGMAALLVVLVHASSMMAVPKHAGEMPLGGLFKFGHAGVDFFFVLSGFIIYFIHARELGQPSLLASYWQKRFIRIFPVYWIVLAVYGVLLAISPTRELTERIPSVALSAFLLLPHEKGPILSVAWSLSHELLFYLLFSVLFVSKRLGFALLGAWAGLIVLNMVTHVFTAPLLSNFALRIFNIHFFFGMFVAYAIRHWPVRAPLGCLIAGTLLFFGAGVLESWGPAMPTEWPPLHLAYASGAAAMLYGLVGLEQTQRLRIPAIAVALGTASYSIYLIHTIVIMVMLQALLVLKPYIALPSLLVFSGLVVVPVIVSIYFSRWIEQPLIRKLRPARTKKKPGEVTT